MSYSDFTLEKVIKFFNLTISDKIDIFASTALCVTNWYSSSSEKNSFGVAGLSIR